MSKYEEFLKQKQVENVDCGLVKIPELNPMLFDFQKAIVSWALRRGRAAVFAGCGSGKTPIQLDWAKHIPGNVLILTPLAVSYQTKREGEKFGIEANICRSQKEVRPGITITNYEMLDHFDSEYFKGIVLDESSILKNFTGKIKTKLVEKFRNTPYKLACTATPAPNDHLELGNHSEFLNIMPSNEMISRWFINDTMQFGSYKLKAHAIKDFWNWVSSWAVCMRIPSDIGFPNDGFVLPDLNEIKNIVRVDQTKNRNGQFFRIPDMSATGMHRELRITAKDRANEVKNIVTKDNECYLIWCHTNYEADELIGAIPEAVEIRGNEKDEAKEKKLLDFVDGKTRVLITKPRIAGFGLNLQCCHNVVFVGLSYSYETYYQAIRRCWRFGQKYPVNVYIVMANTEIDLYDVIMNKRKAHNEMQENMFNNIDSINILNKNLELSFDYEKKIEKSSKWEMKLGDSVELTKKIESNSVGFTIFSPPFSSLYIYSDSIRDMGNSSGDEEFFEHFNYLIPELLRVTIPGRLCAVHCKNLVYYRNQNGSAGLRDFRGEIIRYFKSHGWDYHSEITIWKDPVIEMQRTKAQGLLHVALCKDSTISRQGLPDYLVIFRKWAKTESENEMKAPVNSGDKEKRFDFYIGEEGPKFTQESDPRNYSIHVWQRYASPVWFDIRQTNVLNRKAARESKDSKHICPLQLDVIARAIHLWTNENDLVFDPFTGIGSTGYEAIKLNRRFVGIELKKSYFNQSVENLREVEKKKNQKTLFNYAEPETQAKLENDPLEEDLI